MEFHSKEEGELKRRADDCNIAAAPPAACGVDIDEKAKDEEEEEDDEVKGIRARTRMLHHLKKSGLDDEDNDEHADDGGRASNIFRRTTATSASGDTYDQFWDDDMDGMLDLRRATPIRSDEAHYQSVDWSTNRPIKSLLRESSGRILPEVPISWSSRLVEGECGFEIRFQRGDS